MSYKHYYRTGDPIGRLGFPQDSLATEPRHAGSPKEHKLVKDFGLDILLVRRGSGTFYTLEPQRYTPRLD